MKKKENSLKFLITVLIESFTIGLAVVASVFSAAIVGWLIDVKLLKERYFPWITTFFIIVGAIAGIRNIFWYTRKRMKDIKKNEKK